jgi:hypothetical protein
MTPAVTNAESNYVCFGIFWVFIFAKNKKTENMPIAFPDSNDIHSSISHQLS